MAEESGATGQKEVDPTSVVQQMDKKSTFLTQKGTLGLAKLTKDQITEVMPEPHTRSSQATQLVKARKEMAEVHELLQAKQQEYRERMDKCREREEALSLKQEQTREQVAKFAQFMKENDAKRTRALKRAQDEINIRKQKEKEAAELTSNISQLEHQMQWGKGQLERQLKYLHYLESVMEASEELQEVNDILLRYEALKGTNLDLMNSVNHHNREQEIKRNELAALMKKMQSSILIQQSEVARYQQLLDQARNATAQQEQLLQERESETKERIRLNGESQMAIHNLYQRTRHTHHSDSAPKEDASDIFVALKYIEQRFRDLQWIVHDYQRVQATEKAKHDKTEKDAKAEARLRDAKEVSYQVVGGGGKWSSHDSRSSQSSSMRGSTLRASTLGSQAGR